MALDPQIVRRDKASKHVRQPGEIYQGIVTSTRDDGNVYVKIPSLSITSGPVMPLNSSPSNRLSIGDVVACSFNNSYNSSLVVFGKAIQSADDYSISRYANAAERDLSIISPQEGRVVYILDSDELQIYNGTEWITVIDTGNSENITASTIVATSASIGSLTVTGASTLNVLGITSLTASTSIGSVSATEIGYLDGVTSALQAQINSKAPSASPTFTGTVTIPTLSVTGELAYHSTPETASTSFTLGLSQDGKVIKMTNSTSASVTIPLNSSVAFPIGSQITIIRYGTGSVYFSPSGSVSIRATPGQYLRAQYSSAVAFKLDTNEWILMGDMSSS